MDAVFQQDVHQMLAVHNAGMVAVNGHFPLFQQRKILFRLGVAGKDSLPATCEQRREQNSK